MRQKWLNMLMTRQPNRSNCWHPMHSQSMVEDLVNKNVMAKPAVFEALERG